MSRARILLPLTLLFAVVFAAASPALCESPCSNSSTRDLTEAFMADLPKWRGAISLAEMAHDGIGHSLSKENKVYDSFEEIMDSSPKKPKKSKIAPGKPIRLYTLSRQDLTTLEDSYEMDYFMEPSDHWFFPVSKGERAVATARVSCRHGDLKITGIDPKTVAEKLKNLRKSDKAGNLNEKFVRIPETGQNFIAVKPAREYILHPLNDIDRYQPFQPAGVDGGYTVTDVASASRLELEP